MKNHMTATVYVIISAVSRSKVRSWLYKFKTVFFLIELECMMGEVHSICRSNSKSWIKNNGVEDKNSLTRIICLLQQSLLYLNYNYSNES